jgi:hypothetical protein
MPSKKILIEEEEADLRIHRRARPDNSPGRSVSF